MKKDLAIICDYKLFPERIGGMDYFFVAFDKVAKENGYEIIWFFKSIQPFDFYNELHIESAQNINLESFFLNYCSEKKKQFDVVITHFLQPISSFYKKIKKQFNCYIISVDHNPRPLLGDPLKKKIKNKIKGILYSGYVDILIGVSNYTKKHIIKDYGNHLNKKTFVIYNGINYKIYDKQKLDRKNLPIKFIVISHLRESKGIQDLLEAVNKLEQTVLKNMSIDIYGDGPYKNELLKLREKFKLTECIKFKGNSPTINKILKNYHYLIQPTYMECFSLSILESLASNVPVITTTVGGNPEIVENGVNGFLFKAKDIEKLAGIVMKIVNKKLTIDKNVDNQIKEKYNLDLMVSNHLNLILKAL